MSETIFREKSIAKVKSPDNLNEYIQVSNPGVWTLLAAIIFLLIGFCIWGVFGHVQTVVNTDAVCQSEVVTCYLTDKDAKVVRPGMAVEINGQRCSVSEVNARAEGQSTCTIKTSKPLPDGIYEVRILVEDLRPVSFLLN